MILTLLQLLLYSIILTRMYLLVSFHKATVILSAKRLSAIINHVTMVCNSVLIWSCIICHIKHNQISTLLQIHAEIEQKTMQIISDYCILQEFMVYFWDTGSLRTLEELFFIL